MSPAQKALWFIESHFAGEIALDDIANIANVSRYHIARAFEAETGRPVMRYVRERRLTQAARALADGAPDILSIALEAGYSSHEAFMRAFRDQFGLTPEMVRAQGHVNNIQLKEPIKMNQTLTNLETPRFETSQPLLIGGIGEHYNCDSSAAIPSQWQRFVPHINHIQGQVGHKAYGVRYNADEDGNFDYLCGVEISDFSRLPGDWSRVRIPEQRYAVFTHRDHISAIRRTWSTIWNEWLPQSGHLVIDAPVFELYGDDFNSSTGVGKVELWVPIRA